MADLSEKSQQGVRCAADILRACKNAVVLTGAGISTPSGIPDFRSTTGGLWNEVDPFEVASLATFRYAPEKFYGWLRPLAHTIRSAQPNAAHFSLVAMEKAGYVTSIVTQNIDSLHQKAGSQVVYEVHGTLDSLTCGSCFHTYPSTEFIEAYMQNGAIPRCPACEGVLKPDVIMFGEQLPQRTWLKAMEVCRECDVLIVAGSSLEVLPVASLPMRAVENGAHLIIINQSSTYIDVRADVVFHDDIADILPGIAQEVLGE